MTLYDQLIDIYAPVKVILCSINMGSNGSASPTLTCSTRLTQAILNCGVTITVPVSFLYEKKLQCLAAYFGVFLSKNESPIWIRIRKMRKTLGLRTIVFLARFF
jgi:hypothetical protein